MTTRRPRYTNDAFAPQVNSVVDAMRDAYSPKIGSSVQELREALSRLRSLRNQSRIQLEAFLSTAAIICINERAEAFIKAAITEIIQEIEEAFRAQGIAV
jgi:hypothetical protein